MMGLPADVTVDLYDGVLARIDVSFEPVTYSEAANSLTQKFGKPHGRKPRMTVWRNKRGDLAILDAAGLFSLSSVEDQKRNEAAVREMGKDL